MTGLKVGLIARAEERGLGIQTKAFYDHMRPDRTLLVIPTGLASNAEFEQNHGWYPDATVAEWSVTSNYRFTDPATVRSWLKGLDVVFTAETVYDWRLVEWANNAGVATVCQVNPEFYRHAIANLPHPTMWWAPTPWRIDQLPAENTRLVGVPVDVRPNVAADPTEPGPLRLVHVVGRKAAADRNGTGALLKAVADSTAPICLTIHVQDGQVNVPRGLPRHVSISVERGSVGDRWALYEGHHLLVMPRRFGGLALAAQEAMACGLGLVMTDVVPNNGFYPAVPLPMAPPDRFRAQCGEIPLHNPHPLYLRKTLSDLAKHRDRVAAAQTAARVWASEHSWEAMIGQYRDELARAVELAPHARLFGGRHR